MKQELINNSYMRIPEFLSRDEASALSTEFNSYALLNKCVGDSQVPNSHAEYNFMPFVRLLIEKIPEVSILVGEKVLPTYTYARVYKNGSILEPHRDRPACEISLTINLAKSHDWPIFFQRPGGSETFLELDPGDAVVYMGCSATHWRTPFMGDEYTQVFIHYVRSYGENFWAYFDKKQSGCTPQEQQNEPHKLIDIRNKDWKVNIL